MYDGTTFSVTSRVQLSFMVWSAVDVTQVAQSYLQVRCYKCEASAIKMTSHPLTQGARVTFIETNATKKNYFINVRSTEKASRNSAACSQSHGGWTEINQFEPIQLFGNRFSKTSIKQKLWTMNCNKEESLCKPFCLSNPLLWIVLTLPQTRVWYEGDNITPVRLGLLCTISSAELITSCNYI